MLDVSRTFRRAKPVGGRRFILPQDDRRPAPPVSHRGDGAHLSVTRSAATFDDNLARLVADWEVLHRRIAVQDEVLKLVAIYAGEDWLRRLARRAAEAPGQDITDLLPGFLLDPHLASGCGCCDGEAVDG